ncbi:protein ALTERED XYLOGLUCAN 4-like, partial [Dendrobium catenatum]|uniref:protein ALTERED XYLOGLUCAN 4-like n=1 Tax=Dendrobium catenatum TaxID=906689 RepID=UPI0010A08A09
SGGWKPGCDLSNGTWVRDNGSSHGYTNQTCKSLPESKNCGKYGKNGDYVRWRWQPARCELPRFNAKEFLEISRGKRMAFVGDSVARNQADSLVCLLSEVSLAFPYQNVPDITAKSVLRSDVVWVTSRVNFGCWSSLWTGLIQFDSKGFSLIRIRRPDCNGTGSTIFYVAGCIHETPHAIGIYFPGRTKQRKRHFTSCYKPDNYFPFNSVHSKQLQMEIPKAFHKDPEDKFPIWHFESHNFTLMVIWTKFLVQGTERLINGSNSGVYDLHLDKIDQEWTKKLPFINHVVISSGHWFFGKIYLYEGGQLIGCIYCSEKIVRNNDPAFGLRKAFRKALQFLNKAEVFDQDNLIFLRTFSPAHFENGTWNGGGYCNRTRPFDEGEINLAGTYWEIRNAQVEEINKIKIASSSNAKRRFELLDVTKAMMMRPDAHPDTNWNNQWMRGYSDCVHWCMPGAVDMWNDMLLTLLKKYLLEIGSRKAQ